ncbi:GNAT family N-acetyltransferase [Pseudoalteromonas denitrificans]|uniref:Protein N-acetyltransferase, RimJ/RimL family n=1 Tax=Pseudoalteromonas denitrificans DSM 6059 TaxID=1123010 RepID=A0A1I1HJU3_9GAMM|nr:GNAT family N-acetyltransferase [Pseudoalteromonas denitrificans]SFC24025.1 Protein N-acetyltransferase, RimJ/RimL family [Pseudoalteromonas denitrificans DSM 6059]
MAALTPFCQGASIYLREVREEDITDDYYNWLNDPQIKRNLETRYAPQSKSQIREFITSKQGEPFFAICCTHTHKHIGNIKLNVLNVIHRRADISLLIGDKSYWGKGVATEAISLVTDFAFSQLNLNKIQAGAYHTNIGSIKAFEKCGYEQEGYLKEFTVCNNKPLHLVYLGLTRTQYYAEK